MNDSRPPPDTLEAEDERVAFSVIERVVIATLTRELTEGSTRRMRRDLLELVHRVRAKAVVVDVSPLPLMDTWEFKVLGATAAMVRLMGARTVLCGMRPQVVEVFCLLEADLSGFEATVATVHDALQWLQRQPT
jgi:anti-anti-sigma regulatory factor